MKYLQVVTAINTENILKVFQYIFFPQEMLLPKLGILIHILMGENAVLFGRLNFLATLGRVCMCVL